MFLFYKTIKKALNPPIFDYVYNRETLGFRLSSPQNLPVGGNAQTAPPVEIRSLSDYLIHLVSAFRNVQNNSHLETEDWQRTIFVDTHHIDGFNFNINLDTKKLLADSGRQGVTDYFKWYDKDKVGTRTQAQDFPYNRPDYENKVKLSKK